MREYPGKFLEANRESIFACEPATEIQHLFGCRAWIATKECLPGLTICTCRLLMRSTFPPRTKLWIVNVDSDRIKLRTKLLWQHMMCLSVLRDPLRQVSEVMPEVAGSERLQCAPCSLARPRRIRKRPDRLRGRLERSAQPAPWKSARLEVDAELRAYARCTQRRRDFCPSKVTADETRVVEDEAQDKYTRADHFDPAKQCAYTRSAVRSAPCVHEGAGQGNRHQRFVGLDRDNRCQCPAGY